MTEIFVPTNPETVHVYDSGEPTREQITYPALSVFAQNFWDIQKTRKTIQNRMSAEHTEDQSRYLAKIAFVPEDLQGIEDDLNKEIEKAFAVLAPPGIQSWVEANKGIGIPTIGRILGLTGHPRWKAPLKWESTGIAPKTPQDEWRPKDQRSRILVPDGPVRPRTIAQLWQYCGVGDPNRRPTPGMSQKDLMGLGIPQAKVTVYLISNAIEKAGTGGYFRELYDTYKEKHQDDIHKEECIRCGPRGKPAKEGSKLSKGHIRGRTLRYVGKQVLKEMWIAAGDDV